MDNLKTDRLEILINDGPVIKVKWKGKSDVKDPHFILKPFFAKFIQSYKESKKDIELNFQDMEYMNSSSISPLIQIINDLEKNQMKVDIVYSKDSSWQKPSFKAIEALVKGSQLVTVVGQ